MMRVFRTLAIAGVAAVASVASASPIVTQWNYTVTSAFLTGTTVFTAGTGTQTNNSDLLAWGLVTSTNPVQSQLEIVGSPATDCAFNVGAAQPGCAATPPFAALPFTAPGPLVTTLSGLPVYTDGEVGLTQTFVHRNNPLPGSSATLDEVDVRTTLDLNPLVPNNLALPQVSFDININFKETPNNPVGSCVDGTLKPCADIFVIGGGLNEFFFWYDSDTGAFSPLVDPNDSDFVKYFVQIFPFQGTALNPLSSDACALAGAAFPCQGFKTNEEAVNAVQFAFAITTAPIGVPEPGTLALFALGLVGMGFMARRRQA